MAKLTKMKIVKQRGSYYFERSLFQRNYKVWLTLGSRFIDTFNDLNKTPRYQYIYRGVENPKSFMGKLKWSFLIAFKQCRWNMTYSIAPDPKDLEDIIWLSSLK